MLLADRTSALLIATKSGSGLVRDTLELYIGDTKAKLQLPHNPTMELTAPLDRFGILTSVYAYTLLDEPDGSLTVRVSDPSQHIVHFVAAGTCIETLQANIAEQDQFAVTDVSKRLQEAYYEANREEFDDEIISGDSSGATARVGFLLQEDETVGMARTIFTLRGLIAAAPERPNYNPVTAWQPLHARTGYFM